MGQATCYITTSQGYLSASIEWNSSYYVTVNVTSNDNWRLKPKGAVGDTNNIFSQYGNLTNGGFQGSLNVTYVFQIYDAVEETWFQDTFTVTADSSGGGSGGDTTEYFQIYYDKNGYNWKSFPSNQKVKAWSWVTTPSAVPPDETSTSSDFTITGDANKGTFPSGATTKLNSKKTITTFYYFNDWKGSDGYWYIAGEDFQSYKDMTLYAQQYTSNSEKYSNNNVSALTKPNPPASTSATYTITFNPNGGSLDTSTQIVNATITKVFSRWSSSPTGGSTVTTMTKEGTVYAQWANQYSNNTIILPLPTKAGYNFAGWSKTSDGANLLPAGSVVSITADTTYYAIWGEQEKPSGGRVFIHDGTMWQPATGYIFNNESWALSG